MSVEQPCAERGLDYATLIGLSTGTFVAFGLFSLPMGWLADRFGRRNLLGLFFAGCGFACLGVSSASTPTTFAIWLLVLGSFSAIYHPIGRPCSSPTRVALGAIWAGMAFGAILAPPLRPV